MAQQAAEPAPESIEPPARKVGRPARLDRQMIARAAAEVGLGNVTMKAVADRLGVSVPGLYHHVEGRDDLMALAAEYQAARIAIPVDRGQHWTEWLLDWARYAHDAFVSQPELLNQYRRGAIGAERMVEHLDAVIGVLERFGFSPTAARDAYALVSQCAIGAAYEELRLSDADGGSGRAAIEREFRRALAARDPDDLPHLRRLAGASRPPSFEDDLATVLVGIAVRRGEPWEAIPGLVPDPGDATVLPIHH